MNDIAAKWDARYAAAPLESTRPAWLLEQFAHLLPPSGDALDLACGLGGNALWLARRGFAVRAWDLSAVAIERLGSEAARTGVAVAAVVRDAAALASVDAGFDVIVVAHFLDRSVIPALRAAVRPGGLVFYQTYTRERRALASGPSNPDFLLQPNELLTLFAGWRILLYRDEGQVGDLSLGQRDLAYLVARKPVT
ncbi:MAG: methyltransferase domain-containing protein [Thiotrichales bacterium]